MIDLVYWWYDSMAKLLLAPPVISFCPWMQALDTFNTAVVSPIYYTMFTSLTILASVIMFKVWVSIALAYLSRIIMLVVRIQKVLYIVISFVSLHRIGTGKIQHKLWQRCVALLRSFLELFFYIKQKTWLMVVRISCYTDISIFLCGLACCETILFSSVNVGLSTSSSFRLPTSSSVRFSKQTDNDSEGIPLRSSESFRSPHWCMFANH
jgi:hypothetical protein